MYASHAGKLCTSLYLKPGQEHCLRDLVCSFTFFEVHTSAPYLRCYDFNVPGHTAKGEACGSVDYLGNMVARHPTSYHGPYTVGIYWTKL